MESLIRGCSHNMSAGRGGGQKVTLADDGGRGVSPMLTIADEGGWGSEICQQKYYVHIICIFFISESSLVVLVHGHQQAATSSRMLYLCLIGTINYIL